MPQMRFSVDEAVFRRCPSYCRLVVLAEVVGPEAALATPDDLVTVFEREAAALRERVDLEVLATYPPIAEWREAFRAWGWSASKFRPAVEALVRRALRGELSPLGVSLIDAGTIVTLRHVVPVGVHVLDDVLDVGEVSLGPAAGFETFEGLDEAFDPPEPGELVYKAGDRVLTRRWVWRQGRLGSVFGTPRWLAVNIDLLGPMRDVGNAAAEDLTALLSGVGCRPLTTLKLDDASPSAEAALDSP